MDYSGPISGPPRREDLSTGASQSLPTASQPPYIDGLSYEKGHSHSYEPTYNGDRATRNHQIQSQVSKEPVYSAAESADPSQLALPVLEESVYASEESSDAPSTPYSMPDDYVLTPPRIHSPRPNESSRHGTEGADACPTSLPMYSAIPRQISHRTYAQTPLSWKSLKLSVRVSIHVDNIRLEMFEKMIAEEVERRFDAHVTLAQGARLLHGLENGEIIYLSGDVIDESDTLRVIARDVEALQREMDIFRFMTSFTRLHGSVVVFGSNNPIGSVLLRSNTVLIAPDESVV